MGQLLGTISAAITGLPRRWGLLIIGMTVIEATAFALLGISPNVFTASTILVVVGFGVAYSSDVPLPTFIQTRTPRQFLGRISSLIGLPRVALEPVSIAVLGALLARSAGWGFAVAAIPMLAVGVRLCLDPQARNLRTDALTPETMVSLLLSEENLEAVGRGDRCRADGCTLGRGLEESVNRFVI